MPNATVQLWGVAAGPDGNVWFSEGVANKVARITPAGVITEHSVFTQGSSPYGMTVGPDNRIWFTEDLGATVGAISLSNLETYLPLTRH